MECVELAPAVERRGSLKAGASSTHSKRSARFGCGLVGMCAWHCFETFHCCSFFLFIEPAEWQGGCCEFTKINHDNVMAEKTVPVKKVSDKSTKQEMLEAYQSLAKQLEEK